MAKTVTVHEVITVTEASRILRISRNLAYEAVRSGQIPSVKIGRRILIPRAALEGLLQSSQKQATHE
jgi:excisionase family DNA binding protein